MTATHDSHIAKMGAADMPAPAGAVDQAETAIPAPVAGIPVRDEATDQAVWQTVRLSATNPTRPLLPQNPHRRSAVLLAVDNDVFVCSSLELAQAVEGATTGTGGFYLPKGVAIPVRNKAACWAAATTTATVSRVSVLTENDDE